MLNKIPTLKTFAIICLALLIFLLYGFSFLWPIFKDNFSYVIGDLGDARLNNILLEHSYLYAFTEWPKSYWGPEWLFYPFPLGVALSDVMIGNLPFYAPFRLLGFDPLSSFQGWMVTCCFLNAAIFFVFLRALSLGRGASFFGTILFSFALPRGHLLAHAQLVPQFFSILSLICLVYFLKSKKKTRRLICILGASFFAGWQFWAGFYLGWFMILLVLMGFVASLLRRSTRGYLTGMVKENWIMIFMAGGVFLLLVSPLIFQYLEVRAMMGGRKWYDVYNMIPNWKSYLLPYKGSLIYGESFLQQLGEEMRGAEERRLFLGFALLINVPAFWVLWRYFFQKIKGHIYYPFLAFLCLDSMLLLVILAFDFAKGASLWYVVYRFFPAGGAIRAVGRIILLFMIPWSIIFALTLEILFSQKKLLLKICGLFWAILVLTENISLANHYFAKADHSRRVSDLETLLQQNPDYSNCVAFYYCGKGAFFENHLDAMWASLLTKRPTINGYSGNYPPGYNDLNDPDCRDKKPLADWVQHYRLKLSGKSICYLTK